jgi:glycosyltransferase involved in cell wall biosynthesis
MKIAVLIPDRGDRPKLLQNCIRMMDAQTLRPEKILIVNDAPKSDRCDITYRYRKGYTELSNTGEYDLIAFIENDDYYAPNYLETMVRHWEFNNKPDMIGTAYTVYYHIGLLKWFVMYHSIRSSAMNTLIRPSLDIKWCVDTEPYTDLHLWMNQPQITKKIITPEIISIGIKHGVGMSGGRMHVDKLHRYNMPDPSMKWFSIYADEQSVQFYKNIHTQINN